jgi:uncharacterized protein YdhG (YjbR/CyaY superfamily)
MTNPTAREVDAYIAALPGDRRAALETLRTTIRAAAPDAVDTIAYSMPAFRDRAGQFLVSYAAYKKHSSLFPASGAVVAALGTEVAPFLAGKATLQFPVGQPIPTALVAKVVSVRLAELGARQRERSRGPG